MNAIRYRPWSLICLGLLTVLMGFSPAMARSYIVFATGYGWYGYIFDMDADGHLSFRDTFFHGDSPSTVKITPNNDLMAVMSSDYPGISAAFIDPFGKLTKVEVNVTTWSYNNELALHPTKPLIYAGSYPAMGVMHYDTAASSITCLTRRETSNWSSNGQVYSPYANAVYFQSISNRGIQGLLLDENGMPDRLTSSTEINQPSNEGLFISHDGRTMLSAASSADIRLLRVDQDGKTTVTQTFLFNGQIFPPITAAFSPDDRWLYLLSRGPWLVRCYAVDPLSSTIQFHAGVPVSVNGLISTINSQNLSITPDGRYGVFFGQVNSNVLPYATMIHVVRLDPDGSLTYLADRRVIFNGALFSSSAIAQVNPLNADASWMQYE